MGEGGNCTQGHCTDDEEPQWASRGWGGRAGSPIWRVSQQHTGRSRLEWLLTLSCILGVDSEDSRLVHYPMGEARPVGSDMATVDVIHIELQGAS